MRARLLATRSQHCKVSQVHSDTEVMKDDRRFVRLGRGEVLGQAAKCQEFDPEVAPSQTVQAIRGQLPPPIPAHNAHLKTFVEQGTSNSQSLVPITPT